MSFQYAVKFICGKSEGHVVAPGEYWTAINVHNPTRGHAKFVKRFALAWPGEKPGDVTDFFEAELGPHQAFEIDRDDIYEHIEKPGPTFVKGFAVIISDEIDLDVVAVYSVLGAGGEIALHMERVPPRR